MGGSIKHEMLDRPALGREPSSHFQGDQASGTERGQQNGTFGIFGDELADIGVGDILDPIMGLSAPNARKLEHAQLLALGESLEKLRCGHRIAPPAMHDENGWTGFGFGRDR